MFEPTVKSIDSALWMGIVDILHRPLFSFGNKDITLSGILASLVILLGALLVSHIVQRLLLKRLFSKTRISEGTQFIVRRAFHYLILVLGLLIAIDTLGVDLTALSVFAGLVGIGLGFGLQNIVNNFLAGFTLLLERPVQVGDFIEFEGIYGRVEGIHARSTLIVTNDNISLIVPNSLLTDNTVTNWSTRDPKTRLHIPVGVSYDADPHQVRDILLQVCTNSKEVLDSPAAAVHFVAFGESSLDFEVLAWTDRPRARWVVSSHLHFDIWDALKQAGIEIPFPQRDLHVRSSVPLPVQGTG